MLSAWRLGNTKRTRRTASLRVFGVGGAERDRTVDLLNAIQALSQLSYSPTTEGAQNSTPAARRLNRARAIHDFGLWLRSVGGDRGTNPEGPVRAGNVCRLPAIGIGFSLLHSLQFIWEDL